METSVGRYRGTAVSFGQFIIGRIMYAMIGSCCFPESNRLRYEWINWFTNWTKKWAERAEGRH